MILYNKNLHLELAPLGKRKGFHDSGNFPFGSKIITKGTYKCYT